MVCLGWRQTHGCDANGRRDRNGDKGCDTNVPSGASGFCECQGATDRRSHRVRLSSCDHSAFNCATECARAASHYACDGWRQTGNCSADGPREEARDASCEEEVRPAVSGFCECGGGARRVARPDGCSKDDEAARCVDVCARGESLYEALGLAEGASEGAIKSAFRRISLKLHPDKQRTDAARQAAAARFAEVRAAYDVLSDADARILYDMHGHEAASDKANRKREGESTVEATVSLAEAYSGTRHKMTISRRVVCKGCSTEGGGGQRARCRRCGECPREVKNVNVQFAPGFVVQQQQEVPSSERCEQQHYVLDAEVKRGTSDGDTLTFARTGEQRPGMIPGDVKLRLKVAPDPRFTRDGAQLRTRLHISLREALLGFSKEVTHLDGHTVRIVRAGVSKPGQTLVIAGEGMPRVDEDGVLEAVGDLLVTLYVDFPDALAEEAREWARKVLPGA